MSVGSNLNAGTNTADKTAATFLITARSMRDGLHITNSGAANNIYIGQTSGVSTSTGYKLVPGAVLPLGNYNGAVYVIADNAAASVSWAETY